MSQRPASVSDRPPDGGEELASRHSEAMLRFTQFAVDNLADAAYWIEEDARIIYVNEAASKLLGYAREELVRMHIYELNPEIRPESWPAVWSALERAGRRTFETTHRAKDGRDIPVEISANLLTFRGKRYSCAFARDITERKQLESRLRQAEKMEAIGRLAGGVAHDFNNQLAGIMGYADLLAGELEQDPDKLDLVERILLAVKRSSDLTAQLLAFSRRGQYLSELVDVHDVVAEVVGVLEHSIDKRIDIEVSLLAPRASARGDASQLQSAILNLALNARDAMPEGGQLKFSTALVELDASSLSDAGFEVDPGQYLRLAVSDTGIGMSDETRSRVFEPFFTTKERGRGTGLGLAAVYGTVSNHRGAIRIRSRRGRGTTVELYLPVSSELPAEPVHARPVRSANLAAHVLVVEDERSVRDVATRLLRRMGCRVTAVEDGRQALELYARSPSDVDLVLLDLVMPVMSGPQTYDALRSIDPRVRVLLASGYSREGDARALLERGARGFIQKPYDKAALSEALSRVLGSDA